MKALYVMLGFTALVLLISCDPLALGYVNKLPYPVTIVEHGRPFASPFHLKSGETRDPSLGEAPDSIDVLNGHGHALARYHTSDIRTEGRGKIRYIVLSPEGPTIQLRDHVGSGE